MRETENNAGKYTTRGKILRDARARLHVDEIIKGKLFSSPPPQRDESLVFTHFKAILGFLLRATRENPSCLRFIKAGKTVIFNVRVRVSSAAFLKHVFSDLTPVITDRPAH